MGLRILLVASVAAIAIDQTVAVAASDDPQPMDFAHNVMSAPAPVDGAVFGTAPAVKTGTAICTTAVQIGANANTDCAESSLGPHNETSIAVNPTNPMNIIGGVNDYQLGLNPGGQLSLTILSRAHVTFDGGKTWSMFPLFSDSSYQITGDPAVAFDAAGHAYYGTLGGRSAGPFTATNADVLVSHSGDGGKTWRVVRVAAGSGVQTSRGDQLDKEYVAAWGNGNAIVTYSNFRLGQKGAMIAARIQSAVTHDSGQTWSTPETISGSLDSAFFSNPIVASDGRIFISFLNQTDQTTRRNDYEVVEVSPMTGAALGAPVKVATLIDGASDYPVAFGRRTYQDSVFRRGAIGNIAADPTNAAHLAVVWSDMRNSTTPAPTNPYLAKTNSDVIVSQSFDAGRHWSPPVALALPGDQFQQWSVYDTSGRLRIGTFDRSVDPNNHMYGFTVATEMSSGSLSFTTKIVSTVNSDPTMGDRWFPRNVIALFPNATAFLGDYSNIAATPDGGVVAYWTDMRLDVTFAGVTRKGEDAFFAKTT